MKYYSRINYKMAMMQNFEVISNK